jgi:hypothetical protein
MSDRATGLGPGSEVVDAAKGPLLPVAFESLVAWYPFRQGTGEDLTAGDSRFGDTTDYSAVVNGPTFQASGGTTDIKTGANSGAFDFDGTDDTLDLGTVADSNQSLTFMTWVKVDSAAIGDGQPIVSKANGNDRIEDGAISLFKRASDKIRLFAGSGGSFSPATTSSTLSAGTYAHVAGRYDFQSTELTVFFNGTPEATVGHIQMAPLSSQPWRIGEDNPTSGIGFLNGTVDGARIYQAALSDSQINQIYLNTEP